MTVDTDSYFPAPWEIDPFEQMHREKRIAMFPHLGRELASVVVNFLHYFLLYCAQLRRAQCPSTDDPIVLTCRAAHCRP